jgi:hypothetical protein
MDELGAEAARLLVDRIISGWQPVERREIKAPLLIRRSAGPCREDTGGDNPDKLLLISAEKE